jgi:hypothetical protein
MSSYTKEKLENKIASLVKEAEIHYQKMYRYNSEKLKEEIITDIQIEFNIQDYKDAKEIYELIKQKDKKEQKI